MKVNKTQTFPIGITQLAKLLKDIKGPKTIDSLVNNQRVMITNIAPMNLEAITAILQGLKYGTTYFIPMYQTKVVLIRTGVSTFTTTTDLSRFIKAA